MKQTEVATIAYIKQRLPKVLMYELNKLAEQYHSFGVRLFVFGSFVNYEDRRTSDLDLGVIGEGKISNKTFTRLYNDVQDLPTIRKIDLENMQLVSKAFKQKALKDAVFLKEKEMKNG